MRKDHAAPRAAGGILRARAHGGSTQSLGIACEGDASDLIDFSVNVNPAGPSPRAVAAACKALSRIDAYPDRESLALVRALARAQGIPEDTIVCGAGASDIIWRLAAAVRPKRIVVCAPTFSEYAEAASYYGACVQEFPLSEADDFDVPASFARAIEGPGDVAYLCNPNNPTGRLVDPRVIDAVACRCEQVGALLVVDECFLGFAPDARERSVAARAACSRHVAVLSAFTKLYGMAGLRLGYLISGNAQLIEGIRRAGQAWPVSSVAEAAGIPVERTRIIAIIISTVLACFGQIIFLQNIGTMNTYNSHDQAGMFAIAAILIGGASVSRATITNVFVGVILFHLMFVVSPMAGKELIGQAQLGEYFRVFVSYGIIALALVLHAWKRHRDRLAARRSLRGE